MTSLFIFLMLASLLAMLWLFYDRFTKRGALPLDRAARDFTAWWGYVGLALGEYVAEWLRYLADVWEPLQARFGDVLQGESLGALIQIVSGVFLVFKIKGQQPIPRLNIPKPGAAGS